MDPQPVTAKNITVIGAGIIGLTTAYYLAKQGHHITIVDKGPIVAGGASSANGFQLSYAYLMPPFTLAEAIKQLSPIARGTNPETTIHHLNRTAIFKNAAWFLKAVWQTLPFNYRRNYKAILKLGQQSQFLLDAFLAEDGKDFIFEYSKQGKLVVLDTPRALKQSLKNAQFVSGQTGYTFEPLTKADCLKKAPFLKNIPFEAGIYCHNDHAGNCILFCQRLAELLQTKYNVTFDLNHQVKDLQPIIDGADFVVVANGVRARDVLKTIGIKLPIFPVRGYSYTFEKCGMQHAYVTLKSKGMVISDMGETTRVSGFADFVGITKKYDFARFKALRQQTQACFPSAKLKPVRENTGYRPVTPNGLPIIGKTKHPKVFVNAGQGMFGWTLAQVSAFKLAEEFAKALSTQ